MNLKIKKILKVIIPLLFGGALVWYLFTIIPPETLLEYFKNANYWWIALGLLFGILSHLSRAYRWKFMLEPLGYKPRFINSTLAVLIGYFVNLAIPRAGEVSRATVMTNYEGIPFEKGFGTIVAERIADLIMMFLIIGITLLIQFDFIVELLTKNVDPIKIGVIFVLCVGFGYLFYTYVRKAKNGIGLKIKNFAKSLIEGVTSIFRMKNKWAFIFHTVFIWVMYILMFWATIPAINGLDVPFGGILVGFIAGGFSIAATNGGIGSYPVAVFAAFSISSAVNGLVMSWGSMGIISISSFSFCSFDLVNISLKCSVTIFT